ncbi:hypothetical protein COO60DRAFT_1470516 [Scenedesmus sp. NREL 46B-D3]|nr:hypothetical protein COO60DRAFT_1470516 [Scenedesmus sp. NREL 46B-D3]
MAKLHIDRSATVGWCPVQGPSLLACGTVAGAIDMSFSTSSVLEIFKVDFASSDASPALAGHVQVPERFHRLAWGNTPSDATQLPYGILAGGLADGSICLWNPAAVVDGSGHNPLLSKMQKHSGAVKGLEFNGFSPNLLASGAAGGELCIWDVAVPAQPSLYPALKGPTTGTPGAASASEITYISWNRKVQHILASTQRRCSVLQWNPDVATQLVVASDDDRSPTLQMWDLRNSMSPVKEFVGHTKGVLGMSWCPQDHSLLLSCSKDNRTICWDVATTDVVCELPSSGNWNFDVQWSPTTPGVFSTSTFDGKVSLCNVLECTAGSSVETFNADFSVTSAAGDVKPLKQPPAWLKRPSGVCFGFGGRVVSFSNVKQQVTDPMTGQVRPVDSGAITITQVVTEQKLVEHSEAFEAAVSGRDRAALQELCAHKATNAAAAGSLDDSETWTFMGVLFEDDARRQLLAKLGFADALSAAAPAAAAGNGNGDAAGGLAGTSSVDVAGQQLHSAMEQLGLGDGRPVIEVPGEAEDFFNQADDPHGFFDSLPEQNSGDSTAAAAAAAAGSSFSLGGAAGLSNGGGSYSEPATPMADANPVQEGTEREDDIQKAIFVGNYEGAVDTCLKVGRLADALLVANIGGPELFKRTMHRYMRRNPRPYMAVISAMVDGDYMSLVKTRPVAQWRETLAVLATYTGADQWAGLCDALAARLGQTGMAHAASLCYICAGNVDQAVAYWSKGLRASGGSVESLQAVIEKSVVLGLATNAAAASNSLADIVTTYAGTLATQGRLGAALRYLEMVPGEAGTSVAVLKDRIYRCAAPFGQTQRHPARASTGHSVLQQQQPTPTRASTAQHLQQQVAALCSSRAATARTALLVLVLALLQQAAATALLAAMEQQLLGLGTGQQQPAVAASAYGQQQQQQQSYAPPPQQQQQQYGTAAGYGAAAAGGYGQQTYAAQGAYGAGYGQQQPAQQSVYQPKRTAGAPGQAAPAPQPTFTPAVPAAPGPSHGPSAVHGAFTPATPASTGSSQQQQQAVQPRAMFTPTASATVAQPPPAAAAAAGGYGAGAGGAMAGPPMAGGMMGAPGGMQPQMGGMGQSMAPGGMMGGVAGSSGYGAAAAGPPARQQPPAAPAGPPAHITMASADVSKVPGEHKAVLGSLTNLFNACMPLANTPARKREMDDNSRRLGGLFWKLNEAQVAPHVVAKLLQMCAALDAGNWPAAQHLQVELTASDWDDCGTWLTALKRLIKIRQSLG